MGRLVDLWKHEHARLGGGNVAPARARNDLSQQTKVCQGAGICCARARAATCIDLSKHTNIRLGVFFCARARAATCTELSNTRIFASAGENYVPARALRPAWICPNTQMLASAGETFAPARARRDLHRSVKDTKILTTAGKKCSRARARRDLHRSVKTKIYS